MNSPIIEIINKARTLAAQYYELTGKPLGVTSEIGEQDAAFLLGLNLAPARQEGYDATDKDGRRIQIKAKRVINSKLSGQKLGSIRLNYEWDILMVILINETYETIAIYECPRLSIEEALVKTQSKARQRGQLSVTEVIKFSQQIWPNS